MDEATRRRIDGLIARIETLEMEVKRLRDHAARADAGILRGSRVELSDPAGSGHVLIEATEHGGRLAITDAEGRPRASITVNDAGPHLHLRHPNGKLGAAVAVKNERAGCVLFDPAQRMRAVMSVVGEKESGIALYDEHRRETARVPEKR